MSYKEITKEEALKYLDFSTAISRWRALYQCTAEEAKDKVINCLDERLIRRLGAFAKDKGKKLNISMAFRPFSYQENLAPNNGGKYKGYSENKSLLENLKAWSGINTKICANPGSSNHNSGAAVDANSSWFEDIDDEDLKPYGLTKNVKNEWWHVVVVEMASIIGYDRVQNAIDKGYEPQICPCKAKYIKGRYNKEGASVGLVQAKLKELGYTITVDGFYGDKTKAIIENFQRLNRLTDDGICGGKTIAKLFGKYTVKRILKYSKPLMTGEDIKWLQKQLNANGAKLSVDGVFGPKTETAVKEFQKTKGLTVDGIVGEETTKALGGNFNA